MILISHRGNLDGPQPRWENEPFYVMHALNKGFNVEIDVWYLNGNVYLGHDNPEHLIDLSFLKDQRLWCHAKNLNALELMLEEKIHCFWHEKDTVTITSRGYVWTYPGKQLITNAIACMPETEHFEDIHNAYGVCSDFILGYKYL